MTAQADAEGVQGWDDGSNAERARRVAVALEALGDPPADPAVATARAVGERLRQVIGRLTATSAPPEVLADVVRRLEEVERLLEPFHSVRRYEGSSEASGLAHDRAFFDWSPLLGLSNPLAPPVYPRVENGMIVGRARFGIAYEGPPGCVHGGFIAAAFDEVLGLTQSLTDRVGMTGTLTVRYRRPTPLNTDLRFEGRVESVNGRKVLVAGRLLAGEVVTAEATGLFIAISPERFRASSAQRERPALDSDG